ncbi:MAG: ubiquitin-like small modifier protein 1 [Candidatus Thorarchaeota archaeon]|jgi:molybdopterin synthase sulfur carrier subunit
MRITVRFYATLRDLTGKKAPIEVDLDEGATVSNLLDALFMDSAIRDVIADENQNVKSDITILRNGREIRFLDDINTELSSGDEISIFPLISGG